MNPVGFRIPIPEPLAIGARAVSAGPGARRGLHPCEMLEVPIILSVAIAEAVRDFPEPHTSLVRKDANRYDPNEARALWIKAIETRASRITTADRTSRTSPTAKKRSRKGATRRKVVTMRPDVVRAATRALGSEAGSHLPERCVNDAGNFSA